MTRTLAVLLTNDDDAAFARAFVDDAHKVIALLSPLRPAWRFVVVAAKDGMLPPSVQAYDAYVITGSPASVNNPALPWLAPLLDFIRQLHAARKPTVGLCFGHQAIAKALGGQVQRRAEGWGLGLALTTWHGPLDWMRPFSAQTALMAAHNEYVSQLPPGAVCLGASNFCAIGAMQVGQHFLTTQCHPEMPLPFMQALLEHLSTKLSPATIAQARASLSQPAQSQQFSAWMVQFIEAAWAGQGERA